MFWIQDLPDGLGHRSAEHSHPHGYLMSAVVWQPVQLEYWDLAPGFRMEIGPWIVNIQIRKTVKH